MNRLIAQDVVNRIVFDVELALSVERLRRALQSLQSMNQRLDMLLEHRLDRLEKIWDNLKFMDREANHY